MLGILRQSLCWVLLLISAPAQALEDPFPQVASAYLVQVNEKILWQRQVQRRLPPASLTKLMTALLVLDDYKPRAEVVIGAQAARESGMRMGLKAGQRFHVEDLLAAALISSANDACHALADFVAGNEQQFVERMNLRARKLGMRNTHFANACGHDAADHYSSAQDMLILAQAAMAQEVITRLAGKLSANVSSLDGSKTFTLKTKNALLGRYPGVNGLKTGYTSRAGKCLIAVAERDGIRVLLVMLHGNDRWWDAADILDITFAHMKHAVGQE